MRDHFNVSLRGAPYQGSAGVPGGAGDEKARWFRIQWTSKCEKAGLYPSPAPMSGYLAVSREPRDRFSTHDA